MGELLPIDANQNPLLPLLAAPPPSEEQPHPTSGEILDVPDPQPTKVVSQAEHQDPNACSSKKNGKSFKSQLLDYTRVMSLPFPKYETISDGPSNSLKFRSAVRVGEETYTSPDAVSQKKAAEHRAAKIALERLLGNIHHEREELTDSPEVVQFLSSSLPTRRSLFPSHGLQTTLELLPLATRAPEEPQQKISGEISDAPDKKCAKQPSQEQDQDPDASLCVQKGLETSFKSRLHAFTQKLFLPFPRYQTFCEGSPQHIMFRTSVCVAGETYISPIAFPQKKAAEHGAAKFALERLSEENKLDDFLDSPEGTILSKSILNEFAVKLNMDIPVYTTDSVDGKIIRFMSSVTINGETFSGVIAASKRDAERSAAVVSIKSLLGRPECETVINEIIVAKQRFQPKRRLTDGADVNQDMPNALMLLPSAKKQMLVGQPSVLPPVKT